MAEQISPLAETPNWDKPEENETLLGSNTVLVDNRRPEVSSWVTSDFYFDSSTGQINGPAITNGWFRSSKP
jgi:membrane carboxypeptidase/penicillin-binding protein PbpC